MINLDINIIQLSNINFMETLKSMNIDRISTDFKKSPNTIFWFNQKGEYLAEYNWNQKKFWVSYRKIWQEYESDMSWSQIKESLKNQVERKFHLEDISVNPATTDGVKEIELHFR